MCNAGGGSKSPGADLRQGTLLCAGCANEAAIIEVLRAGLVLTPPTLLSRVCQLQLQQPTPVQGVYINLFFHYLERVQGEGPTAIKS